MGKISVVVNIVSGEAGLLPRCLKSVAFADELVIVDMGRSVEAKLVAQKHKASYFSHEFVSYVEPARNFGISKAQGEWILVIDPDEAIPPQLGARLRKLADGEAESDYYLISRKNVVFGKWLKHSRWWPDYNVRFFKKGKVKWGSAIHQPPITTGKGTEIPARREYAIIHHHYTTLSQYLTRLDRYTTIQAKEKKDQGYVFDWSDIIHKPFSEFISRYFAGQGYRDGLHGLVVSVLQAFSELIVYLKVWEIDKFEKYPIRPRQIAKLMAHEKKELRWWMYEYRINYARFIKKVFLKLVRKVGL